MSRFDKIMAENAEALAKQKKREQASTQKPEPTACAKHANLWGKGEKGKAKAKSLVVEEEVAEESLCDEAAGLATVWSA